MFLHTKRQTDTSECGRGIRLSFEVKMTKFGIGKIELEIRKIKKENRREWKKKIFA